MTDDAGYRVIQASDTEVRLHNGIQDEAVISREADGRWHVRPLLAVTDLDDATRWPAYDSEQQAIDAYLSSGAAAAGGAAGAG